MKCFGCGVDKDLDKLEIYSHPETDRLTDKPIPPLLILELRIYDMPDDGKPWRIVVVCHECFHQLDPDMWISDKCWASLSPKVAVSDLPVKKGKKWEVSIEEYAEFQPK